MTGNEDQSRKNQEKKDSASSEGIGDDEISIQENSSTKNDPLFLSNSEHPGMLLTGTKFDGTAGFATWKRSMTIVLSAKNKMGFVDGTLKKESFPAARFQEWKRCDNMVISWLLTALERDIAESVAFNSTAELVWNELISRFEENNVARLYAFEQELAAIKQGDDTVRAYYTKVKSIWDEIDSTDTLPTCSCNGNDQFKEFIRRQRAIIFLMSVNPKYAQVRGNVLMMSPLSSVQQIYSLLVQEERQKGVGVGGNQEENVLSFAADFRGRTSTFNTKNTIRSTNPKRSSLHCNHCQKMGHTEEKCFEKIGYPPNWRNPKGRRNSTLANVTDVREGSSIVESPKSSSNSKEIAARTYTAEEINQILAHLAKTREDGSERAGKSNTSYSFVGF